MACSLKRRNCLEGGKLGGGIEIRGQKRGEKKICESENWGKSGLAVDEGRCGTFF